MHAKHKTGDGAGRDAAVNVLWAADLDDVHDILPQHCKAILAACEHKLTAQRQIADLLA